MYVFIYACSRFTQIGVMTFPLYLQIKWEIIQTYLDYIKSTNFCLYFPNRYCTEKGRDILVFPIKLHMDKSISVNTNKYYVQYNYVHHVEHVNIINSKKIYIGISINLIQRVSKNTHTAKFFSNFQIQDLNAWTLRPDYIILGEGEKFD